MGSPTDNFSIIDKGLHVEGTINSKGKIIVKGSVKGTIVGDTVVIAEEGSINAEVKVANMTIGGTFEGELRAMEKLTVLATGSCSGKVTCKDLVVEPGGVLNADVNSLVLPPDAATKPAGEPKEKKAPGK